MNTEPSSSDIQSNKTDTSLGGGVRAGDGDNSGRGLSIIIPVADDPEGLEETLESLRPQLAPAGMEIIVVNDGGHERVSGVCKRRGVRMVAVVPNGGSYRARNAGAAEARFAGLGFLDANVRVCPEWVKRARRALDRADYVGGPIGFPPPKPGNWTHLLQISSRSFKVELDLARARYAPTANLLVRRVAFEALGGFDARLRSTGDADFGRRLHAAGRYTVLYDPELGVTHPFRTFREIVRRQLRICMGQRQRRQLRLESVETRMNWRRRMRSLVPVRMLWDAVFGPRNKTGMNVAKLPSRSDLIGVALLRWILNVAGIYGDIRPWCRPDHFEWDDKGRPRRHQRASDGGREL